MTDTAQDTSAPFQLGQDSTWMEAVALFEADAASWLTTADAPQLMALRAIARQLDGGTFQAALISQFTLIHRTLREKGDPARAGRSTTTPPSEKDAILDMFENGPMGGMWRGDQ